MASGYFLLHESYDDARVLIDAVRQVEVVIRDQVYSA